MTASTEPTGSVPSTASPTPPGPTRPAGPARPAHVPVAVVGTAALTPGASTTEGFWRNVLTGRDLITDVPEDHWLIDDYFDPDPSAPDRTYARRGAFLPAIDFDPSAYGIPPNALPSIDTTQLLALSVAERVLADAGLSDPAAFDGERTGVILGTAALELLHTMSNRMQRPVWLKSLRESGVPEEHAQEICDRIAAHYVPWQEESFPGYSATWSRGASRAGSICTARTSPPTRPAAAPWPPSPPPPTNWRSVRPT